MVRVRFRQEEKCSNRLGLGLGLEFGVRVRFRVRL
jgi:hypothetical protein